jgi:hypothetical protein
MVLVMSVAIALIPPTLFPVIKQFGEASALAYIVARTVEVVLLLPATIGPLMTTCARQRSCGRRPDGDADL